jgi:tellurite resistance protein TerC
VNPDIPEIPTTVSLGVILVVLTITTVASLVKVRRDPQARAHTGPIAGHGHTRADDDSVPPQ